jgi:hypothetical protein
MRTGWRRLLPVAAVLVAAAVAVPAGATSTARPNISPSPSFTAACAALHPSRAHCIAEVLAAIDHARALQHVHKKMILPRNFTKLTWAEQVFVISDLERVDRGLKPFVGMTKTFDRTATAAADADADPAVASWTVGGLSIQRYGGNWSGDFGPLASDYAWMYDDGYGSGNISCAAPKAPGCWGHRANILGTYRHLPTLVTGVGVVRKPRWISIAQLFVAGSGKTPSLVYTWRQALAHGADGR